MGLKLGRVFVVGYQLEDVTEFDVAELESESRSVFSSTDLVFEADLVGAEITKLFRGHVWEVEGVGCNGSGA